MFRYIRILGYNNISRTHPQQTSFFLRWNSTVAQENDIVIKVNSNEDAVKKKEEFDISFSNVTDVSTLLKHATSAYKINFAFKALDLLAVWYYTRNIKFDEVEKDENYGKFVSMLETQANKRNITEIIRALKNLKNMNVPSDKFVIESLENDLLWKISRVSVQELLNVLAFQVQYTETEKQKKVVENTIAAIEKRWTEVKSVHDFSIIYSLCNSFSHAFIAQIDDHLIEHSEHMSIHDLTRIFTAIGNSKRRPTPVLRNLAYRIFKMNTQILPKHISNVLYTMNTLSFPDEALMGKLSTDFIAQIEQVKQPAIIGSVALCMGQMRWKDKELLDALGKWIMKNIEACRCNDIVSFIVTLATVHYIPDNIDVLLNICISKLDLNAIKEKNILVDIVWALIVLGKATTEQMSIILDPSFISDFALGDPTCVGLYLKLLNINAAAEVLETSYTGPKLQFSHLDNLLITQNQKDIALNSYVQKILYNFLPPPKYMRGNVRSKYGFIIDAELVVDKMCNPLDCSEFTFESTDEKKNNDRPIPTGAHKVAIMVWNFKDYTMGSSSLTGQNAFAVRVLKKFGYNVVEVPYYDINKKEKIIRSVQYFEKKIRETVNK